MDGKRGFEGTEVPRERENEKTEGGVAGLAEAAEVLSPLSGAGDHLEDEFPRLAPWAIVCRPLRGLDCTVPTGLRDIYWASSPTLKRGANKRCAYGARYAAGVRQRLFAKTVSGREGRLDFRAGFCGASARERPCGSGVPCES